jgi:hypothetical protein
LPQGPQAPDVAAASETPASVPDDFGMPVALGETASPTPRPATAVAVRELEPDLENTVVPILLGETASPSSVTARLNRIVEEGELNPCRVFAPRDQALVDAAQRRLFEMLCSASLWFDGLFGERRNLAAAQGASGRLELSVVHSEYEGTSYRGRGNVRVDFPNLDERVHAFLGRDDEEDFIQDRTEGLALRSQFLNVETNEGWLAGLGYGLPGSFRQRSDVRVGARLGSETKIFVQGRHRRNWILDRRNIWRFRETIFWTNRDGFGSTTSLDYDHIFRRAMLLRWANVGTITEETRGFEWRTATLLYQDIPGPRAIAYEAFLRGWTDAEVPIREYGARAIFRHSLLRRNWLVGEFVLGYSWPREELEEPRDGSLNIGIGVELYFGRDLLPP